MAKAGRVNTKNLLTLVSVGILVGTEFLGVAVAAGWALAGYFQLGETLAIILMSIFGVISVYALARFMKRAVKVEPVWSTNSR